MNTFAFLYYSSRGNSMKKLHHKRVTITFQMILAWHFHAMFLVHENTMKLKFHGNIKRAYEAWHFTVQDK